MIRLGYDDDEKSFTISSYVERHGIDRVIVFGPNRFRLPLSRVHDLDVEHINWPSIIEYVFYYRLLREIGPSTLLVLNEPLRTQARHDLTYNCLRNFLQQTRHQIVFSFFPIIDTIDDFMVLVDLDTRSRWRREAFQSTMLDHLDLEVMNRTVTIDAVAVPTSEDLRQRYAKQKRLLVDGIGLKDPHTIPRNLHLVGGETKAKVARDLRSVRLVGRSNRFKLAQLETYDDATPGRDPHTVFEFCHRFIDWSDFLVATGTTRLRALVTDLKVDHWYLQRFTEWAGRLRDGYATLHG